MSKDDLQDFVIGFNDECKRTLFDKLSFSLASDIWFYVHLGNYSNTTCSCMFPSKDSGSSRFSLSFDRWKLTKDTKQDSIIGVPPMKSERLFTVDYDPKYESWDSLHLKLKEKARTILGVE